jgi:predicted O-methyltransferase YrrM
MPIGIRRLGARQLPELARIRSLALGAGLARPRAVFSPAEAALIAGLVRGRRRVVQIGVREGASALVLVEALGPGGELHALEGAVPRRDGARRAEALAGRAARRVVARAARRAGGPALRWHTCSSAAVASDWALPVDVVLVDADHSEIGVMTDWDRWHRFVVPGGSVVFAGARASQPGGRGLPGPTAAVDHLFRGRRTPPDWQITAEVDGAVVVTHTPQAA